MARPKKVHQPIEIPEIPPRPTPQVIDPRFGYSRPAPKPSPTSKGNKNKGRKSEE